MVWVREIVNVATNTIPLPASPLKGRGKERAGLWGLVDSAKAYCRRTSMSPLNVCKFTRASPSPAVASRLLPGP